MTGIWVIVYLVGELFGNATVHLDPANGWGTALVVALILDAIVTNNAS